MKNSTKFGAGIGAAVLLSGGLGFWVGNNNESEDAWNNEPIEENIKVDNEEENDDIDIEIENEQYNVDEPETDIDEDNEVEDASADESNDDESKTDIVMSVDEDGSVIMPEGESYVVGEDFVSTRYGLSGDGTLYIAREGLDYDIDVFLYESEMFMVLEDGDVVWVEGWASLVPTPEEE